MDEITLKHIKKGQLKEKIKFLFIFNLMKSYSTSFLSCISLYKGVYIIFLYYSIQFVLSLVLKNINIQDNTNISFTSYTTTIFYIFPLYLNIFKAILKYIPYLISFILLIVSINSKTHIPISSSLSYTTLHSNSNSLYKIIHEEYILYAYFAYAILLTMLLLNIVMTISTFQIFYFLFIVLDIYFCWIYYSVTCLLYDNKKFAIYTLVYSEGLNDTSIYKLLEEKGNNEKTIKILHDHDNVNESLLDKN